MKAIVQDVFGGPEVLRFAERPKPTPKKNQVLIRVCAVGLNAADKALLRGRPLMVRLWAGGFFRPGIKTLGADVAGVIESIGPGVTEFAVGDAVLLDMSGQRFGGLAEYVVSTTSILARKPEKISFEEAAALPMASLTALQALRDSAKVKSGMDVLIIGASGGVGSYAVQLAKHYGAIVTAVCSTRNVDLVRKLGADQVIDYTKHDVTKGTQKFDVIIDMVSIRSIADYTSVMKDNAVYKLIGGDGHVRKMIHGAILSVTSNKSYSPFLADVNSTDLAHMCSLVVEGAVKPLIDKVYAFVDGIEAVKHIDSGHCRGKVIVTLFGESA